MAVINGDGSVGIYELDGLNYDNYDTINQKTISVTWKNNDVLTLGDENGSVSIYYFDNKEMTMLYEFEHDITSLHWSGTKLLISYVESLFIYDEDIEDIYQLGTSIGSGQTGDFPIFIFYIVISIVIIVILYRKFKS